MYIINSTFGSPATAWDPLPLTPVWCNHLVSRLTCVCLSTNAHYHSLPIQMFTGFKIKCSDNADAYHLISSLEEVYTMTLDMEGKKYCGLDLD